MENEELRGALEAIYDRVADALGAEDEEDEQDQDALDDDVDEDEDEES